MDTHEIAQALEAHQLLLRAMPRNEAILYGLVDVASHDSIYDALMAEPEASQVCCLLDGTPGIRFARVAPYLLQIHVASAWTQDWLSSRWNSSSGLFLASTLPVDQLKRHLKKFLHVSLPGGQSAFFRFYDPRVMQRVIPVMQPGQRGDFFGVRGSPSIDAVMVTAPERSLVRYTPAPLNPALRLVQACGLQADIFHMLP